MIDLQVRLSCERESKMRYRATECKNALAYIELVDICN